MSERRQPDDVWLWDVGWQRHISLQSLVFWHYINKIPGAAGEQNTTLRPGVLKRVRTLMWGRQ